MLIKDLLQSYKKVEKTPYGRFNESYFVDDKYVLRIAPSKETGMIFYEKDMILHEPVVHKIVAEKTNIPIPKILKKGEIEGRNYVIMDKLKGIPNELNIKTMFELGKYIRQLHDIHGNGFGYFGPNNVMGLQKTWQGAFELMWKKLVNNNLKVKGLNKYEAEQFIEIFDEHKKYFDIDIKPSLLHADLWYQNILTDNGKITGILDWDRSLWGDPGFEFAIMDYCGLLNSYFFEGYGKNITYSKDSIIRKKFYLAYEVQKYIIIYMTRRFDLSKAKSYKDATFRILNEIYDVENDR